MRLEIPKFASEAEEAAWWPAQEDRLTEDFEETAVKRGSAIRRILEMAPTKQILRCAQDDNSGG
jgi:hypothetical protein